MNSGIEFHNLKDFLDEKHHKFNRPDFIPHDPISIPHQFSKKQDIEIMGLWAAILAWGQRKTIISKCNELVKMMDGNPHDFILNHSDEDLKPFLNFKHRTFNDLDALYFISFFKQFFQEHDSLEEAFLLPNQEEEVSVERNLSQFHDTFFKLPIAPERTKKHIATPARNSACKRICMFLRWMVRQDNNGVDFGIWKNLKPSQLVCPCDVHVDRVARNLGLISRPKTDWKTALELTENLKKFDQNDPIKYDFALFGIGIESKSTNYTFL